MGLHIYTGSLVRFFTNDWENEIQQLARKHGWEYQVSYREGKPDWPARGAASEHLSWMKATLASNMKLEVDDLWNDEISEYHAIKLHDEAREAIVIVAAHLHRPDLAMPTQMPGSLGDDIAYAEATTKGYFLGPIAALESTLAIPASLEGVRLIEDPLGEKRLTCSTEFLRGALRTLAQDFWRGAVEPNAWLDRGLAYARASGRSRQTEGKWVEERDEEPIDSLKSNAEFAFGVLTSILDFSDRHRTAIVTSW